MSNTWSTFPHFGNDLEYVSERDREIERLREELEALEESK